ncbi:tubulin-specific chaperone cofactor E-like protein [Elysia marginata]|uniref:Tubulin-specific chaperone cofactor E-like protein n=1 Tax=Elysia marginata TaxID=1093978 RepID=A0AAV4IMI4_9GAST|nr:tubulin-specific chaperone cofactor E-like protein [Elysia marginata]
MENRKPRTVTRKLKKRTKSFTEALKEKYCMDDEPTFDFIIVSPKRKSNATDGELAHLRTVVLNEMDVTRADIPQAGLTSLCPNVVDLDLANNLLESWHELIAILGDLPRVKYVNLSGNKLRLHSKEMLPNTRLSVENLALNATGSTLEEVVRLSNMMPALKELHLCGNDYIDLADIDSKISDGAFSALECMRLNNNGITNWSEVWKLRHLPQLKYLILSGNPIQDIFYSNDSKTQSPSGLAGDGSAPNHHDSDIMDTAADLIGANADLGFTEGSNDDEDVEEKDEKEEEEGGFDDADCYQEGSSSFCDYDDDDDDDADCFDNKNDSSLEGRPVSRFGYHRDPEVVYSDEGSDTEQDLASTTEFPTASQGNAASSNKVLPSGNINIPHGVDASKRVHNTNFNNSRGSLPTRSSPFDDASSSSSNLTPIDLSLPEYPDQMGQGMLSDLEAYIDMDEEDNPGDWPRLAAEQFLYDLIDQLDLGDTTVMSSTASSLSTNPPTLFSSTSMSQSVLTSSPSAMQPPQQSLPQLYSQHSPSLLYQTSSLPASSAVSSSSARSNPVFPPSINFNQNAAFTVDVDTEDNINKMLAAVNDATAGSDVEDDVFARIYSDEDFIPRSVSMVDDAESYSPPKMPLSLDDILLSTGKSKAQRCLFGQPSTLKVQSNSAVPENQSSIPNLPLSERESDSCSDCEAEQHGLTAALRRELAEANEAAARPAVGPGSWLELNRSFETSVRDSGEGYSITTTQTTGARVVVTGLNYNSKDNPTQCSREAENNKLSDNTGTLKTISDLSSQVGCSDSHSETAGLSQTGANCADSCSSTKEKAPFHQLQMLCLSNASVSHWDHLKACTAFPMLNNVRLKNNPLYSSVNSDDRRKLYIASLPKVTVLNGGEVTATEREKAERFFLRYFMDSPEKPELYATLVTKHGPPVQLVDIDLGAGYQEWATLTFKCEGAAHFTRRLHLVEPVARLRTLVSQVLGLPKWCFMLHHHPCGPSHPECEREIVELRCEALPMSRFDFAEGDEIIVDVRG